MLYVRVQLQQPVTTDFELGPICSFHPAHPAAEAPKIRAQISARAAGAAAAVAAT